MERKYLILLYYHYANIENPEEFREEHHLFCLKLNLRGRIIVAREGLNGTVSGNKEQCEQYMEALRNDPILKGIEFKVDQSDIHAFQKMHVRVKDEIVNSSLKHIMPRDKTGVHLEPEAFKAMKDQDDVVVLDVRSNYEHSVGRFKNAITLDMDNFRDFPEKISDLKPTLQDKKILTYCTGGIKCEKASAYLLEQGFENVYQLHGGIINYGLETGGEDFDGKCYVFDNRITVDVNKINPEVISKCYVCNELSDRMVNCANPICNLHVPICEKCGREQEGACSESCKSHPEKREYDGTGYYAKEMNGYNPYKGLYRKDTSQESG